MSDILALILVGGKGTRLGEFTSDTPKPLLSINGKPFLNYVLKFLHQNGITRACLLTGFQHQKIEEYYQDNSSEGIELLYSMEKEPLGTGGAVRQAMSRYNGPFYLCLNGDSLFPIDLKLLTHPLKKNSLARLALSSQLPAEEKSSYGLVDVDDHNMIKSFREKSDQANSNHINGGIYFFSNKIDQYFTQESFSLEDNLFPLLAKNNQLEAALFDQTILDIGTPNRLNIARTHLR